MINVTLIGPDSTRSVVLVAEDATVRDVATSKYDLFSQITKRNGVEVDPFTRMVTDGDTVNVEAVSVRD